MSPFKPLKVKGKEKKEFGVKVFTLDAELEFNLEVKYIYVLMYIY